MQPPTGNRVERIARTALRARSLTDDLVDLLIETIHRIGARAERKVERELLDDLKRVTGKQNLLFELAEAMLAQPDGMVRDVVFPVVGEQTLRCLWRDADRFIAELQAEMREALSTFDTGLKRNRHVRISAKGGGWITLSPLDAQPDPPKLTALKAELNAIWPMTDLLDIVKETKLWLGCTDVLKNPTAYEALERALSPGQSIGSRYASTTIR